MPDFSSELARELAPSLLERFDRYVRIDTQSRRARTGSPSTPGQLDLARVLVADLEAAGCEDVSLDQNGYVTATVSANGPSGHVVGLVAHMDTSPDAPGAGVEPLVHRGYDGGVIELPRGGTRLDPISMPELAAKLGHDIVTSSGDTLLGADDKAGVAEIVTAVTYLVAHPELPRPTIRICFTPDEEIGQGATLFDIPAFGAECAYTLDGSEVGEVQNETFSAIEITLRIHGVEVHPGQATGKLVNALRLAGRVLAELPTEGLSPETTSDRDGFIHPYELVGSAGLAEMRAIVRDFDDEKLDEHVELFRRIVDAVMASEPVARAEIETEVQYRNMRPYVDAVPHILQAAEEAIRAEGLQPTRTAIRGGTDGSRLSEMGLPTPNLFTGGHEFHSPREWASLQDMASASATVIRLAAVWSRVGEVVSAP
jgi:tripeptide aminopeptidase